MTLNFGIIGGGGISDTHARAVTELEDAQVVAFYGDNPGKVANLGAKYDAPAFTDLSQFLNHRPMDAVIIGSPSGLHAAEGIAAAQQGLHVLVEKPIDVTVEKADALIAECAHANVKLAVCFQDRFAPDSVKLKKLIDDGGLGKLILVSARVKWYRPPEYYGNSRWRGRLDLDGGGALMNQGIHTVDLLLWLLGGVRRVYAKAVTALHKIESEDTVVATLEFANGIVGTLEAATSAYPGYDRRFELTGSEGTVVFEHDRIARADLKKPVDDLVTAGQGDLNLSASSPIVSDVSGHKRIITDFMRAISGNTTPRCDGLEGRRSVALVNAIYESSRTGLPVDLTVDRITRFTGLNPT
jgi:UDP-N-acetyl-2-amino-2-deoxyglucuronate dehydrogenase